MLAHPVLTPALSALSLAMMLGLAEAERPVQTLDQIEGHWEGRVKTSGIGGHLDLSLQVTDQGALLNVKRLTVNCDYVIAPGGSEAGQFQAFVIQDRNGNCRNDQMVLQTTEAGLTLELVDQWQGTKGQLTQVNGPSHGSRVFPDPAIRGVTLGTPLGDLDQFVPEGASISIAKSSRRVVRGARQLDGRYRQITVPYSESEFRDYSQDNLGLYHVPGDANTGVMVITRFYAPSPLNAPTAEAFTTALITTYGTPANQDTSSRRKSYDWHFDLEGQLATGAVLERCQRRVKSSGPRRMVAMRFSALEFLSSGRARAGSGAFTPILQPRHGCGYSLSYTILARADGSLENAQAIFFDHQALATEMWSDVREDLQDDITRALARLNAAATTTPEL
ncbi:hypothetical protein [Pseudaestuariivita rosea]|uniref:hypothetical protein n=1 Tax=Pseudaestuariivita rosea TaxID=2763263 RepID=UPI001ABB40C4|nr:hypothetical protein [Pseudaestuariivita rosea]